MTTWLDQLCRESLADLGRLGPGLRWLRVGAALVIAVLAGTGFVGCKQRVLNDRSQADAVTAVYDQRAYFLWPVVKRTGAAMKDVSVCWYEANRPWPVGKDASYRFSAEELRESFLQSSAIRSASGPAQYVSFEAFAKEAQSSGIAASRKKLGTRALCGGAAVGGGLGVSRLSSAPASGKKLLVLSTAAALFCGGALVRSWVSKPSTDQKVVDNRVHRNLESYLKTAFLEDSRIEPVTHQALVKTIVKVIGRPTQGAALGPCPEPKDALREIEGQMTREYEDAGFSGSSQDSGLEAPASESP